MSKTHNDLKFGKEMKMLMVVDTSLLPLRGENSIITIEVVRGVVLFKTPETRPICLLASLLFYGGYKDYYLNLKGQKYQSSLYHVQVFRIKVFGFDLLSTMFLEIC